MKKLICLLLVFVLVLSVLASCGEEKEQPSEAASKTESTPADTSTASEDSSEEVSAVPDKYGLDIPVIDLENRVIRVIVRNWGNNSMTFNGEIIQREEFDVNTADALDVAKYETRQLIEQRYNCSIEGTFSYDVDKILYNQLQADIEDAYDMAFESHSQAALDALSGTLQNIASVETIDLSNPWWDQNSVNDLSIGGKLYMVDGDINTFDNDGTFIMFFNKDLLADVYPGLNMYELVENNEWTIDKFYEIIKGVTRNSNEDDVLDEYDTWGFGTETYNCFLQTLGGGRTIVRKNSDDLPEFAYRTEEFYDTLSKIYDIYLDDANVMVADGGKFGGKYDNVWESTIIKAFRDGRELFYMGGMFNFTAFRELEFHIGYLPVPKSSPEQDRYYHFLSVGNSSCLCIPASLEDTDEIGIIIEALGAESKNNVSPVYYNKCIKGKDADSEEDERMLDIIFNSRCFDLGAVFNWGGVVSQINKINKDYVSRFESISDKADVKMQENVEYIMGLDY